MSASTTARPGGWPATCSGASDRRARPARWRSSPARSPTAATRSARWASATSWPRSSRPSRSSSSARSSTTASAPTPRPLRCSTAIPTSPASTTSAPAIPASPGRSRERGRAQSVVFLGHELTEGSKPLLLDGTLDGVIDQNPRVEAREALNLLTHAIRRPALRGPSAAPAPDPQGEHSRGVGCCVDHSRDARPSGD